VALPEAEMRRAVNAVPAAQFRKVMSRFATGVTVVTTDVDGEVFGMTANAFMAGSLTPPLCVISIARGAKMHARLAESQKFGVSFLSEQQAPLAQHFAGRAFAPVEPVFRRLGEVSVLAGSVGVVAADIVSMSECGDHTIFFGHIAQLAVEEHAPLLFYSGRYAALDREQRLEQLGPQSFW
jgi:flavin reductase (DIM6/NTAB) family NADH-FMN oxidoreductase RutF